MPTPELARTLADLGGFALFLLLIVVIGVGLFREWWVPGYLYQRERHARELAETQAERNAKSIAELAKWVSSERRRVSVPPRDRA